MISAEHLTKYYGDFAAVRDLTFTIEDGHVYGFLGPNGAGKSTTMNIMTGCLSATSGRVTIDGHDIFEEPKEAKKQIGYLPEQPPLYLTETPEEYLRFVGEAKGLKKAELADQIETVLLQTGTAGVRNRRIGELSKGYRQRVGIAQALLGNPRVIILDEPTVGLDPIQILEIRDLIRELGKNHTVLFSSHILSEVQAICDRILILSHGRLIAMGDAESLEQTLLTPGEIALIADAGIEETRAALVPLAENGLLSEDGMPPYSLNPQEDGRTRAVLKLTRDQNADDLCRALFFAFSGAGIALLELTPKKASLEDIFLELTEDRKEESAS